MPPRSAISGGKGDSTDVLNKRIVNVAYLELHNPEDAGKRKHLGLDPEAD